MKSKGKTALVAGRLGRLAHWNSHKAIAGTLDDSGRLAGGRD